MELFGSTRDEWIKEDLAGWLAPNRIYDGVPAVLSRLLQQAELYIVTTKQACTLMLVLPHLSNKPVHIHGRLLCLCKNFSHLKSQLRVHNMVLLM